MATERTNSQVPAAQKPGGDEGSAMSKYSDPSYKTTHPTNEEITKAGQNGVTKGIETK